MLPSLTLDTFYGRKTAPGEIAESAGKVLRTLYRWRALSTLVLVGVLVIGLLVITTIKPEYKATALLEITLPMQSAVGDNETTAAVPLDTATVQTEAEKLGSGTFVRAVISRLGLADDPEFGNGPLSDDGSWISALGARVRSWLVGNNVPVDDALAAFARRLTVETRRGSRIIEINFQSGDPEKAARIVNTLAEVYLNKRLAVLDNARRREKALLEGKVNGLGEQMRAQQRALETYRAQEQLPDVDQKGGGLTEQQLLPLSQQLSVAKAERAGAEARLASLEKTARSSSALDALPDVTVSPTIANLRAQETTLLRKEAELATQLGARHPKLIETHAELVNLRMEVTSEIQRQIRSSRIGIADAIAKERRLAQYMGDLQTRLVEEGSIRIRLQELEHEAATSKQLHETFQTRINTLDALDGIWNSGATVVSAAEPPVKPASPNLPRLLAVVGVLAVGLAGLAALVAEHLRAGFVDPQKLQAVTGAKVIGMVPATKREDVLSSREVTGAVADVGSRIIRVPDEGPMTVIVTSSVPQEGKSAIALALARHFARVGKSTVLLDCDLRRPAVHRLLSRSRIPGITDYVLGDVDLDSVLQIDQASNLRFVAAGSPCEEPNAIIRSVRFKRLNDELKERGFLSVIDTAPLLVAADVIVLSTFADKMLFVVRWGHTRRSTVLVGLEQVADAGWPAPALILSRVNVKRYREYGLPFAEKYSNALRPA